MSSEKIIQAEATLVDSAPAGKLALVVRESGLELESAQSVLSSFEPLLREAEDWRKKVEVINVTDVTQVREMKLAREGRLALREIRINAEKARKRLKEDSLRRGKAIDGVYNVIEFVIAPLEKRLLEQEQFAERREAERKAALKAERESRLRTYAIDPSFYKLDEMPEPSFLQLLESCRLAHEAKLRAEQQAEADRIAREKALEEERARVRAENERLRREAAEHEESLRQERLRQQALREVERQKAEAEKLEIMRKAEQARKEAEELQRKERERLAAEHAELQRKAALEREARLKVEAEAKARDEAERARQAENERLIKLAALAPDKEKIRDYVANLRRIPTPELKSEDLQIDMDSAVSQVLEFLDELAK